MPRSCQQVFNGMAIVVGVSVNYMIEGNKHPASLVGGKRYPFGLIIFLVADTRSGALA